MPDLIKNALVVVGVLVFLSGLMLFQVLPWHPDSNAGWIVFMLGGGPFLIGCEWLGEKVANGFSRTSIDMVIRVLVFAALSGLFFLAGVWVYQELTWTLQGFLNGA